MVVLVEVLAKNLGTQDEATVVGFVVESDCTVAESAVVRGVIQIVGRLPVDQVAQLESVSEDQYELGKGASAGLLTITPALIAGASRVLVLKGDGVACDPGGE